MLISKYILLDRGYEFDTRNNFVDYKLQNMEGLLFNYLSFEYLLVLVYLLVCFTSYTRDVNTQSLYNFCYSIKSMYVNVDTSLSVLLFSTG